MGALFQQLSHFEASQLQLATASYSCTAFTSINRPRSHGNLRAFQTFGTALESIGTKIDSKQAEAQIHTFSSSRSTPAKVKCGEARDDQVRLRLLLLVLLFPQATTHLEPANDQKTPRSGFPPPKRASKSNSTSASAATTGRTSRMRTSKTSSIA
jgi:hypothetical protein